jgi:hypothetical protein
MTFWKRFLTRFGIAGCVTLAYSFLNKTEMLIIQDILVSDEVLQSYFACNLEACRGACCWEGDWGAPLESEECHTLESIFDSIKPYLSQEGIAAIDSAGPYVYYEEPGEFGTTLRADGACVFMTHDEAGIAQCGIERAYQTGATDFPKPISCHLYPLRVSRNRKTGFEALNYDQWDICSAACDRGRREKIPLFQFVEKALKRKYGEEFFEELEAAATYLAPGQK